MSGPLSGLRIIEMAGIGPGPFCAMLMADLGAEVIRIHGKGVKQFVPLLNTPYDVLARGRRSLAIDLKAQGAVETLLRLVENADALLEGFRPGVMERLGLGPDVCLSRNPKLVFGRMTGWGQTGPLKAAAGHDINYLSLTGVLHAIGDKGATPTVPLNVVADMGGGGMLLALGMVSALLEVQRSGMGQVVDAAMTDGAALLGAMMYGFKAGGQWNNERASNLLDGGAYFYGTYECADGRYFSVGAIEPQFHAKLIELLGLDKAEFLPQDDISQWPRRRKLLEQVFLTRPRDAWSTVFEGTDACAAPILNWDEAPAHPHNRDRETFVEISGVVQPAPAPRFSRTPCSLPMPPQTPGQETDSILADWGIPQFQLARLKESGAI